MKNILGFILGLHVTNMPSYMLNLSRPRKILLSLLQYFVIKIHY